LTERKQAAGGRRDAVFHPVFRDDLAWWVRTDRKTALIRMDGEPGTGRAGWQSVDFRFIIPFLSRFILPAIFIAPFLMDSEGVTSG